MFLRFRHVRLHLLHELPHRRLALRPGKVRRPDTPRDDQLRAEPRQKRGAPRASRRGRGRSGWSCPGGPGNAAAARQSDRVPWPRLARAGRHGASARDQRRRSRSWGPRPGPLRAGCSRKGSKPIRRRSAAGFARSAPRPTASRSATGAAATRPHIRRRVIRVFGMIILYFRIRKRLGNAGAVAASRAGRHPSSSGLPPQSSHLVWPARYATDIAFRGGTRDSSLAPFEPGIGDLEIIPFRLQAVGGGHHHMPAAAIAGLHGNMVLSCGWSFQENQRQPVNFRQPRAGI